MESIYGPVELAIGFGKFDWVGSWYLLLIKGRPIISGILPWSHDELLPDEAFLQLIEHPTCLKADKLMLILDNIWPCKEIALEIITLAVSLNALT